MKKIQGIMATTHIDRQGDQITREELETIANQIREHYFPLTYEHDIRNAPIGRIVTAEVIKLQDGEYALQSTSELFEESESLELLSGDGRRIKIRDQDIQSISVDYDYTFRDKEGQELLYELSQISGEKEEPRELAKKALEPVSTFLIAAGVFIFGSIATGFFSKLGSDLYERLKNALIKYARKKAPSDQILDFCFLVKEHDTTYEIHVLVVNPSEQKLLELFVSKFAGVDTLLASLHLSESDIAKVFFEYENQRLLVRYAVRNDCVPLMLTKAQSKESNSC